ncbi:hypothetical protein M011DRAFT_322198 [Sporormia fimetaria CBS 119925]|uniref:Glycine zipper 2TM domain-containing protein n=1 Tax=Sporormia fimetaria CBS 119925 TaxID=1340428 RepID=A0A6A6VH42_9PLEO|nr:hypothetical protein M011DRAFT_322198 [Sporormia fimetaria CBS 119925]
MSLLAFKAIDYGADRIPDKFWEKIPGGFFATADDKNKKNKQKKQKDGKNRTRSEDRDKQRGRRRSHRATSPPTDYSDYSAYDDTDYESDRNRQRQQRRRRTRSLGRSPSNGRPFSRGREREQNRSLDGSGEYEAMDRGPQYPPPPAGDYRPYNPADYAQPGPGNDSYHRRANSAIPDYGYQPQVNTLSRSRSYTAASAPPSTPVNLRRRALTARPASGLSIPLFPRDSPNLQALICRSPFETCYSPSYDPPMATVLSRTQTPHILTPTNSPQPSTAQSRYTPNNYSPTHNEYSSYAPHEYQPPNPEAYNPSPAPYHAPGNTYPSPPPLYRHQSRSQPSLPQYPHPSTALIARPEDADDSSQRHHRHGEGQRHRARSADPNKKSPLRSRSRMADELRHRFDGLGFDKKDLKDRNLAASVGGALAGGLAGRKIASRGGHGSSGKEMLSTIAGAAIGALSGRELERVYER